jgi:D-alanyl-lipoteichoic acid acyltransferase DltB (MBOAT superfamily)
MLFNSLDFALFLPIVFILYWFVFEKNLKWQNAFVFVASYIFYAWWDWRFLSLILFSTFLDFWVGVGLSNQENSFKRKVLLWISISVNLSFLGFFKYYNFFLDNFVKAFSFFGSPINIQGLDILLPVGISFYTFQTMSYSIDVYKRKLEPTKDFIAFGAFVSFFPQLVAGPIERATNLMPQFFSKREFDYNKAVDGCRQILWGLFKKIVIADNCAGFVETIFTGYQEYNGATLFLGAVFFAFQIYGDFSGYSDIAIGTSRLFGFNLMQNFAFPYFSRDMAEFWRRWHISLSTWFRDYLYIPLGGSNGGKWHQIRNTFIIFIVSGFWHGASWTFIAWGFINAVYFIPLLILGNNRKNLEVVANDRWYPTIRELLAMGLTFTLSVIAWVFFRAKYMSRALEYLSIMLNPSKWGVPEVYSKYFLILFGLFVIVEWFGRRGQFGLQEIGLKWRRPLRLALYFVIIFIIFWWMGSEQEFIYFQF